MYFEQDATLTSKKNPNLGLKLKLTMKGLGNNLNLSRPSSWAENRERLGPVYTTLSIFDFSGKQVFYAASSGNDPDRTSYIRSELIRKSFDISIYDLGLKTQDILNEEKTALRNFETNEHVSVVKKTWDTPPRIRQSNEELNKKRSADEEEKYNQFVGIRSQDTLKRLKAMVNRSEELFQKRQDEKRQEELRAISGGSGPSDEFSDYSDFDFQNSKKEPDNTPAFTPSSESFFDPNEVPEYILSTPDIGVSQETRNPPQGAVFEDSERTPPLEASRIESDDGEFKEEDSPAVSSSKKVSLNSSFFAGIPVAKKIPTSGKWDIKEKPVLASTTATSFSFSAIARKASSSIQADHSEDPLESEEVQQESLFPTSGNDSIESASEITVDSEIKKTISGNPFSSAVKSKSQTSLTQDEIQSSEDAIEEAKVDEVLKRVEKSRPSLPQKKENSVFSKKEIDYSEKGLPPMEGRLEDDSKPAKDLVISEEKESKPSASKSTRNKNFVF